MMLTESFLRLRALGVAALLAGSLAACDDYPKDPGETLESVRGGTLQVGLIEGPPWVQVEDGRPLGAEVALVEALAISLDARVEWFRGTETELMTALEGRLIDLVIGGLIQDSGWSQRVAFTRPYLDTALVVASPSLKVLDDVVGLEVEVTPGTLEAVWVEGEDGLPVPETAATELEAKQSWELGAEEHPVYALHKAHHVLAVPKGENAWLSYVDRFAENHAPDVARALGENVR